MKFALSLFLSFAAHICVIGVVIRYFLPSEERGNVDSLASIDVSNLSLSFSVEEDDAAQPSVSEMNQETGFLRPAQKAKAFSPPEFEQLSFDGPPAPETAQVRPDEETVRFDDAEDSVKKSEPSESVQEKPLQTRAPLQARIDALPKPERRIIPRYPRSSKRNSEQGDVVLSINVNENGLVSSADVLSSSGYRALDEEAIRAVMKAKFAPAVSGGKKVPCIVSLTIKFRLKEGS